MSEDRVQAILDTGQAARALLENEMFQRVMTHMKGVAITEWSNTAPGSAGLREEKYHLVRALEAVDTELRILVERAQTESFRLEKAEARNQAAKL